MEKQFVATAYVIDDRKRFLLVFHRKLQKWLPPGGHLEPNELPSEGAKREVLEETGIEVELIQQENVWIQRWNANSFPRPYLCLLEEIPAFGDKPAHQHVDMIYLARPVGGALLERKEETDGIHWFTWEELSRLEPDVDIFVETLEAIAVIRKDPILEERAHVS
jgi:ADP-ribose pyrophosphatase YjhB (NUDIX family)